MYIKNNGKMVNMNLVQSINLSLLSNLCSVLMPEKIGEK